MITTTLKKIRACNPCKDGWKKLCRSLGGIKKYGEDTPIKFSQILESNGLNDAIWCLRTICPEHEKEVRLFAADCAERVLHLYEKEYPNDNRPRKAIQAARDYANGKIDKYALGFAGHAARSAAWEGGADWDAARNIARGAAWDAAWAAGDSARCISRAAAWESSGAARRAVKASYKAATDALIAREAEKEMQKKMLIKRFG